MDKGKTIIIKKVKKGGHGGHHGGSWKVAYADFVTAMMAFFLLLWLLSMTSDEKRVRLAEYFKNFSIFDQGGTSFMAQTSQIKMEAGGSVTEHEKVSKGAMELSAEDLKDKLSKSVKDKLGALEKNIQIDITEDGVRIQITDPDGTLFTPGSPHPTPKAKQILKVVADNIKDMPNLIAVEGHTDGSGYQVGRNTNWELSSARASTSRQELEGFGLHPDRIARVVGYADKKLLIKDDPKDPRNRRISVLIMPAKIMGILPQKPEIAPPPPGVQLILPSVPRAASEQENITKKSEPPAAVKTQPQPAQKTQTKPRESFIEMDKPIMGIREQKPQTAPAAKQGSKLIESSAPRVAPPVKKSEPPEPKAQPAQQTQTKPGTKPKEDFIKLEQPIQKNINR
ncbi:MAG: OmpA family protein [Nitrospirae bacterium]|nr:OmpA family protein [Nitrospirota bacterium]